MPTNNKTYKPILHTNLKANIDIISNRFVSASGTNPINGGRALGVSETKWANGEFISLISLGTAIIETASSVNIGDPITSDASGKARLATGAEIINGIALHAVTGAGYTTILLK